MAIDRAFLPVVFSRLQVHPANQERVNGTLPLLAAERPHFRHKAATVNHN
jgi:hypothetical protein